MKTYSTQVPGKWILAGEHAVLRGVPAVVFPLRSRVLDLSYVASEAATQINLSLHGEHGEELRLLLWGVIERACEMKNISRSSLTGELSIKSSIPVGAGMGASAALCVAVTKWMNYLGYVSKEEMFEFARSLENLFHGESSGVDIAVSLSGQGLHYERGQTPRELVPRWTPQWYISYSGKRGVTLDCVRKVKDFLAAHPTTGAQLDQDMRAAVALCEKALVENEEAQGRDLLCEGIRQARAVFDKWGLTEGAPQTHMELLLKYGALAVKPTGSGGGGYVLSLWNSPPPAELASQLIPC